MAKDTSVWIFKIDVILTPPKTGMMILPPYFYIMLCSNNSSVKSFALKVKHLRKNAWDAPNVNTLTQLSRK